MNYKNDELLFEKINNDFFLLYVPTRGLLAKINKEIYYRIIHKEIDLLSYFSNYEYIDIGQIHTNEISAMPSLSINISNGCQLKCEYCYLSAQSIPIYSLMSYEKAVEIFDTYVSFLNDNYSDDIEKGKRIWISFYGGAEPTYNFPVLKKMVHYIRDVQQLKHLNICLRITTNGYYSCDIAHFISKHFDSILLSFDGPEKVQNLHRKASNGNGSYNTVYDNARIFFNTTKGKLSFRMTLSPQSIEQLDTSLAFFAKEFPNANILIGKVASIGRAANNDEFISNFDYTDTLLKAVNKYQEKLNFTMLNKRKIKNIRTCYCGAVQGRSFILSQDNIIRSCAHQDDGNSFSIGRMEEGKLILDNDKIAKIQSEFSVLSFSKCVECIAKYYCVGCCPSNEIYSPKDNDDACILTKKIFLDKVLREVGYDE